MQEEKQVEEEEGKGRDSLQSLEESIRPLWGFRHNLATTNLTEIAIATFVVRIQESEKAPNLTKTTKVLRKVHRSLPPLSEPQKNKEV